MGNKNSHVQTSQKNSANEVSTNRQDESDDSDDNDDIDRDNIQLEVEIYECLNGESEAEVKNCIVESCKSNHERYTPVENLYINKNASLQILPEAIRHDSVLEFIKIHEKLVVRIRTRVRGETGMQSAYGSGYVNLSEDQLMRNGNCRLRDCSYNNGQVHENYGGLIVYTNKHVILNNLEAGCCNVDFFYYNENSLIDIDEMIGVGSFWLKSDAKNSSATEVNSEQRDNSTASTKDANNEMTLMENCQVNYINSTAKIDDGNRHDISSTAKIDEINGPGSVRLIIADCVNSSTEADRSEHKIDNNAESNSNNDDFMYTSELLKGITAYGCSLREDDERKDLVGLRICYHDPQLFNLIQKLSNLRSNAWSKIPEEIKLKMRKYAIIVSHPHGLPKRISFGDLISLEQPGRSQKSTKETMYNAMTCSGCSGAPVVTGYYSYRPFVHKGKNPKTMFGFSHSY